MADYKPFNISIVSLPVLRKWCQMTVEDGRGRGYRADVIRYALEYFALYGTTVEIARVCMSDFDAGSAPTFFQVRYKNSDILSQWFERIAGLNVNPTVAVRKVLAESVTVVDEPSKEYLIQLEDAKTEEDPLLERLSGISIMNNSDGSRIPKNHSEQAVRKIVSDTYSVSNVVGADSQSQKNEVADEPEYFLNPGEIKEHESDDETAETAETVADLDESLNRKLFSDFLN